MWKMAWFNNVLVNNADESVDLRMSEYSSTLNDLNSISDVFCVQTEVHSENASNVFPPTPHWSNLRTQQSRWICVSGNLGQGNYDYRYVVTGKLRDGLASGR